MKHNYIKSIGRIGILSLIIVLTQTLLYAQGSCVNLVVEEMHKAKEQIANSSLQACITVTCSITQEFRAQGQNKASNATEQIQLFFAGEAMRMVASDREVLQDNKNIITIMKNQREILHLPIPASAQVNSIDYRTMMLLAQEQSLLSAKKNSCKDSVWNGEKVTLAKVYFDMNNQRKNGIVNATFVITNDNKLKAAIYTMVPTSRVQRMTIVYSQPETTSCPKQLYDITKSIYTAKGTLQEEYKGYKLIKNSK